MSFFDLFGICTGLVGVDGRVSVASDLGGLGGGNIRVELVVPDLEFTAILADFVFSLI